METFVRAKREADRAQEESLLDEATGLYNFRGMARRARETGAEALRVRGAMACVRARACDGRRARGSANRSRRVAEGVGEHLGVALARTARASDVIGHLGRGEFAVIAPATTPGGRRAADGAPAARAREHGRCRWADEPARRSGCAAATSRCPTTPRRRSTCSRCSSGPPRRCTAQSRAGRLRLAAVRAGAPRLIG